MWRHPEVRVLPDIPAYWAARTPGRVAIRCGTASLTWQQLDDQVRDLAGEFGAAERAGTPVAYLGHNSVEFWLTWFAAGWAGRPFVPLNWRLAIPELAELLADARPGTVVVQAEFAVALGHAVGQSGTDPRTMVFDPSGAGGAGLSEWLTGSDRSDAARKAAGNDVALIAYTSGTTGAPKGAMHLHEGFSLSALSDELEPTIRHSGDDIHLMAMPNFHLAGSWVSVPVLYHGGTLVIVPVFEPGAVIAALQTYRPTTMCLVPTAIQLLVNAVRGGGADLSSLRTLIYAGSPISAATVSAALDTLGCELRQFYGTTECYIISILRPADHDPSKPDLVASAGAAIPLVQVRVVDLDGHTVPTGDVGEVQVHTPIRMAGFLGRPELSAEVFTHDGWYQTGDLGYLSAQGHITLVDRAKDMVVTGGENVYSVEVERAIQAHPDVAMAAVVGTPDPRWGQAVTAYVVPVAGRTLDPEEIREYCRHQIAGYKVPKSVHVRDCLPLTPSGKVRKVDLRADTTRGSERSAT